jgi:tetratricopeptide (TPR) repeat protein
VSRTAAATSARARLPDSGVNRISPRSVRSALLALAAAAAVACSGDAPVGAVASVPAGPLRLALAAHAGDEPIDHELRAAQQRVRERADTPRLERLATLFLAKARRSGDDGFHRLAESCADAMPQDDGGRPAAALLRGHVRHALHDFAAAERIARDLVATRGMFLDHGLLGDVLLDQGRLDEARDVYQRMLDLKPCLQSYARAAQLRWVHGDLAGARELLALAATAGSQRDPESSAWVACRRATLELHAGDAAAARELATRALALVADYPAALFAAARASWALGEHDAALPQFARAAERGALPEYRWAWADALRAVGRDEAAAAAEAVLRATGEREDPRTFALWLATGGRDAAAALRLAEAELRLRQDPLTWDVVALARLHGGDLDGARTAIEQALRPGTADARVRLHAAAVALALGDRTGAADHATRARSAAMALLPGERAELDRIAASL